MATEFVKVMITAGVAALMLLIAQTLVDEVGDERFSRECKAQNGYVLLGQTATVCISRNDEIVAVR